MDPDNAVVKLCVAGMEAEWLGRNEEAHACYQKAWEERQDDLDACIAAHYLARQQSTPEARLRWNRTALEHASQLAPEQAQGFYPSLYLNMGKSCEETDDAEGAQRYYALAKSVVDILPESPYRNMVMYGITGRLRDE